MANYLLIGASSGIGKACAQLLINQGHTVFGSFRNHQITDARINSFEWDSASDFPQDLPLPEALDGLVYFPGNIHLKPFHRFKEDDFMSDFQSQVLGAVKSIQFALPRLKKANQAAVILFSTVAVQRGFPFHSLVSTSKGAIEGLSKALAAELSPGIRVNCIAPGLTNTPLAQQLLNSEEKMQRQAERNPLKSVGESADLAEFTAYLLSDKAKWITGQVFHVDGGSSTL